MKRFFLVFPLLVSLLVLASCSQKKTAPQIVTTFYPMYEFTRAVVGSEINVICLVPSNQDVHEFEPSAYQMAQIADASAVVYNDRNLEKWAISTPSAGIKIEASADVKKNLNDPHTWLSPREAILEVKKIEQSLSEKFPGRQKQFQSNAEAYIKKLKSLDDEYDHLASVKQKIIVTQHDALSYLARDYGLTQIPIAGLTPESEPSPATISALKETMARYDIHTIYFEANSTSSIAAVLARESGGQLVAINTIESISKADQNAGENYVSFMQKNYETLERTLNQ